MYTEKTSSDRYSIQELTQTELELLVDGLVVLKTEKLSDEKQRQSCIDMHYSITNELKNDGSKN